MLKNPYELNIDIYANAMIFRDRSTLFFFEIEELYTDLIELRKKLSDVNICAFDLMNWPEAIFVRTPLRYNPGSAKWVYLVIETWVTEFEDTIHKDKKSRLFNNFLKTCNEYVKQSERTELKIIKQWTEKGAIYKELFEQEFILFLLTYSIQLTNDPDIISNFINGLAILPEYLKTKDKFQKIEFNKLTKPIFDLIEKDIKRCEEIEKFMNKDFINQAEFYRMGIHFPFSKRDFFNQIQLLTHNQSRRPNKNVVFRKWITFKNTLLDSELNNSGFSMNADEQIKLSQKTIALVYIYNGKLIDLNNANEIAANYGWKSKTSGHKIYDHYCIFNNKTNRIGEGISLSNKQINNKIKLLESVLPYLSDEGKSRAKDEIKILELKRYDNSC